MNWSWDSWHLKKIFFGATPLNVNSYKEKNVADDVGRFHKISFIRWWNNFTRSAGNDPTLKKAGESAPEHTEEPRWPRQAGFAFVSLFCPQLSAPLLTSAVHETTLKQVAGKEGRKLQCLLRASRSPGCFVRASCSPSLPEPVTFQRGTTLLAGTARTWLLLSCVMSKQAAELLC